jgi:hypothetical protein
VIVVALLLALLRAEPGEEIPVVAAVPGPTVTTAVVAVPPSTDLVPAPPPAGVATPRTTVAAGTGPATTAAGPRLSLSAASLAFGTISTAQPLEIANDGDTFLTWTADAGAGPFSATPAGGSVAPGDSVRVTVRLNRAGAPDGRLDAVLQVSSNGGAQAVSLTASVNGPPVIDPVTIDNPRLGRAPCSTAPTAASVRATVIDPSGVDTVVLRWRDPAGTSGRAAMVAGPDSTYSGRLGPYTAAGTVTWWVEATDTAGADARSPDRTAIVSACG